MGKTEIKVQGFFDSGNKVYRGGCPVSVVDKSVAEKLVDITRIKDGVKIHTVTGSKSLKVFTADKLEYTKDGKVKTLNDVKFGISPARIDRAVLHCDLLED